MPSHYTPTVKHSKVVYLFAAFLELLVILFLVVEVEVMSSSGFGVEAGEDAGRSVVSIPTSSSSSTSSSSWSESSVSEEGITVLGDLRAGGFLVVGFGSMLGLGSLLS